MRRLNFAGLFRLLTVAGLLALPTTGLLGEETAASSESLAQAETGAIAPVVTVPNLAGTWSGTWSSNSTRHQGPMTATFCQLDALHYQVRFQGRFFKLIPFRYHAVLTVTGYDANGRVLLSGSHHLGPVMGTFSYNAWATDTQFVAGYCSQQDQGQFVMSRRTY